MFPAIPMNDGIVVFRSQSHRFQNYVRTSLPRSDEMKIRIPNASYQEAGGDVCSSYDNIEPGIGIV